MSTDPSAHSSGGNRLASPLEAGNAARPTDEKAVDLSVVSPIYDEADSLEELVEQLASALKAYRYEILLVDDGSRDDSWASIHSLADRYPETVRGIRHRRNFGKAEALATGFAEARGNFIVTIDADLQDEPAEIPSLLNELEQGADLVSGWKRNRRDPISKTLPSRFFNLAARAVSGIKLHDFNCGLKAYRREVTQDLNLYGELHRFIPILAHAEGYRVVEVPVTHHPRAHGRSKYGWGRLAKGALDLVTVVVLTRYLRRPAHFFGGIGLLAGFAGGAVLAYLSIMKLFFDQSINNRPLFFFGILAVLFAGQMISTGIIGELLIRHRSAQHKDQQKRNHS